MNKPGILILTSPPASGKTRLATHLASAAGVRFACIGSDVSRRARPRLVQRDSGLRPHGVACGVIEVKTNTTTEGDNP